MKSRPLQLKSVIDLLAEDIVSDYLDGGQGRVPDLSYISLIYGVEEGVIYRKVKEVEKMLLEQHRLKYTESASDV